MKHLLHCTWLLLLLIWAGGTEAQVNLTATGGTPTGSFPTLTDAFTAVNVGTHTGTIVISIAASTAEPGPAILNSSGAGAASYTSLLIQPTADSVAVVCSTANGRGVIELNGADNVTINGDNPNSGGINRNLYVINTAVSTANYTSCIRIALSTLITTADNNAVRNCVLIGSAVNRNQAGITGTTTAAHTTWGLILGAGASTASATTAPGALSSVTTTIGGSASAMNFIADNNYVYSAARGIAINGSAVTLAPGLQITNNLIGSTDTVNSVYSIGITAQGSTNAIISGNLVRNVQSFLATAIRGIDVGTISTSVSGSVIERNTVTGVINHNTNTYGCYGININGGSNNSIINNIVYGCHNNQVTGTGGFGPTNGVVGIRVAGTGTKVYHNSVHLYQSIPGSTSTDMTIALGITAVSVTGTDIRNNFLSNQSSGGNPTGTRHVVIYLPNNGTSGMNLNINNNAMHAGTDPFSRLAHVGTTFGTGEYFAADFIPTSTTPSTNLRAYTSALSTAGNNDSASFANTSPPPFVSNTDLHIPAGTASSAESGGASVGVATDVDNDVRPGPAGSTFGGATAPDMGADEFDGVPVTIDGGAFSFLLPSGTGCYSANETIRVRVRNYGILPINLSTDPITISTSVTGPNPVTFPNVLLNTGMLAPGADFDTIVATGYNMLAAGTYTFTSYTQIMDDNNQSNDTALLTINIIGGIVTAGMSDICLGDSTLLTASGYLNGGTVQWQESPDGLVWSNIGGATSPTLSVIPTDTMYYRVLVCGNYISAIDTVNTIVSQAPVAQNVTRCGPGQVTLNATGNGTISWFDAASGGNLLAQGPSYSPTVSGSTTFYAENSVGGFGNLSVGAPNNGQNTGYTLEAGLFFDAFTTFTLQGVYVYPVGTGPGIVDIALKDASATNIQTVSVNLTGTPAPGIQTFVPLNFVIQPGTNYSLVMLSRSGGVANLVRDGAGDITGGGYPFTIPGVVSITSGRCCPSAISTSYYYFYNWQIAAGCTSPRTPVSVTVTPADTILATAPTNPICANQSTPIYISSNNAGYNYTWTPASGLNQTTGDTVIAGPPATTTYTIDANDPVTGCLSSTQITIDVVPAPVINAFAATDSACIGTQVQLDVSFADSITIGTLTTANTATGMPSPYASNFGGTRIQYLYLASELQNMGFTAGSIDTLLFYVNNPNSSGGLNNYEIKMGHTNISLLTTTFETGLTTVSPPNIYVPLPGWNAHPVSFVWDGFSNIIIETCFNNVNAGYTNGNASVRYTNAGFASVVYYGADNNANVCTNPTGTTSLNRANIKFVRNNQNMTFAWTPVGELSNASVRNPVATVNTGIYTVTATNLGCNSSDVVVVTPVANPTNNLPATAAFCLGGSLVLNAGNPGASYLWQDQSTGQTYTVTGPGNYTVSVTNAFGCTTTASSSINFYPFTSVNIGIDLVSGSSADLDAGAGFSSYMWSTSQTTQGITVTNNGVYWVTVTDANGCSSSDTISIVFSLDVPNADGSNTSVLFYPNPTAGIVNMSVAGLQGNQLRLQITDINGKTVYRQVNENPGENFIQQLDLTGLSAGTYSVHAETQTGAFSSRLILVK